MCSSLIYNPCAPVFLWYLGIWSNFLTLWFSEWVSVYFKSNLCAREYMRTTVNKKKPKNNKSLTLHFFCHACTKSESNKKKRIPSFKHFLFLYFIRSFILQAFSLWNNSPYFQCFLCMHEVLWVLNSLTIYWCPYIYMYTYFLFYFSSCNTSASAPGRARPFKKNKQQKTTAVL